MTASKGLFCSACGRCLGQQGALPRLLRIRCQACGHRMTVYDAIKRSVPS